MSRRFMMIGGQRPATVEFLGTRGSNANQGAYTYADMDLGDDVPSRSAVYIFVRSPSTSGSTVPISVTVEGQAVTKLLGDGLGSNAISLWAIAGADIAGLTDGDVVVDVAGTGAGGNGILVYAAYDLINPLTMIDSVEKAASANPQDLSIDVLKGGLALGFVLEQSSGITHSWTGLSEDFDGSVVSPPSLSLSAASLVPTVTGTLSIGVTASSGLGPRGFAASFR